MNVKFLPEARDELLEAVAYYEGEASGLGSRLWEEVDRHIAWIERNYEVPRVRPGGYRRVNLKLLVYRPRARHLDSRHRARPYTAGVLDRSTENGSLIA